MKKIFTLLLFFILVNIANATDIKYASSYEEAVVQAKEQNKKLMLFMHSDYCPWCKKMKRTTLKNKEVVDDINKNYIFVQLDIDFDDFPSKFKPNGVPTTYVIDPIKEEKMFTMRGYKSAKSFLNRIQI